MHKLYVVGTPIGNLEDITLRALRTLSEVDLILAEDTRVTVKLLKRHDITTSIKAWHQHSSGAAWNKLKKEFESGMDIAFVTDAGTPGISDPGGKLIELVRQDFPDYSIIPIPGPSAVTTALSVAGIPTDRFTFLGFLPHKKGRQTMLGKIQESEIPIVLFESVHRIEKLLAELADSGKKVVVCRELTKQFETLYQGDPGKLKLPASEKKGEFVVIVY